MSTAAELILLAPIESRATWRTDETGKASAFEEWLTADAARAIQGAFNAQQNKLGVNARGLPIFVGHPDEAPTIWRDDRRRGRIDAIELRGEGLCVLARWNDLGAENRRQGYLTKIEPAWLFDLAAAQRTRRIEPRELRSAGLVDTSDTALPLVAFNSNPRALSMSQKHDLSTAEGARSAFATPHDLSTAESRRRSFAVRTDELTRGEGLSLDAALERMRDDPADAALLEAMGTPDGASRAEATPGRAKTALETLPMDFSTPEKRAAAFAAAIDSFMRPRAGSTGGGMSFDEALRDLSETPEGSPHTLPNIRRSPINQANHQHQSR